MTVHDYTVVNGIPTEKSTKNILFRCLVHKRFINKETIYCEVKQNTRHGERFECEANKTL